VGSDKGRSRAGRPEQVHAAVDQHDRGLAERVVRADV